MCPVFSGLIEITDAPASGGGGGALTDDALGFWWESGGALEAWGYTEPTGGSNTATFNGVVASITPSFTSTGITSGGTPFAENGENMTFTEVDGNDRTERNACFFPSCNGGTTSVLAVAYSSSGTGPVTHIWLWDLVAGTQASVDIGSTNTYNNVQFCALADSGNGYVVISSNSGSASTCRVMRVTGTSLSTIATLNPTDDTTSEIYSLGVTRDGSGNFKVVAVDFSDPLGDIYTRQLVALPGGSTSSQAVGDEGDETGYGIEDHPQWCVAGQSSWAFNLGGDPWSTDSDDEYGFQGNPFTYNALGSGNGRGLAPYSHDDDASGIRAWGGNLGGDTNVNSYADNDVTNFPSVNVAGDCLAICSADQPPAGTTTTIYLFDLTDIGTAGAGWGGTANGSYVLPEKDGTSGPPHFGVLLNGSYQD